MSDIAITDNLLSQYIVDSATLTDEELAAVEIYLTQCPEEAELMQHIFEAMSDEESFAQLANISNVIEVKKDCYSEFSLARVLIDDIMQECSEEELFARFERECAEQRDEESMVLDFGNVDYAAETDAVKKLSNK